MESSSKRKTQSRKARNASESIGDQMQFAGLALPVSSRLFLRLASCVMIAAERSEEILQA